MMNFPRFYGGTPRKIRGKDPVNNKPVVTFFNQWWGTSKTANRAAVPEHGSGAAAWGGR